jgi:hypothetical protein
MTPMSGSDACYAKHIFLREAKMRSHILIANETLRQIGSRANDSAKNLGCHEKSSLYLLKDWVSVEHQHLPHLETKCDEILRESTYL